MSIYKQLTQIYGFEAQREKWIEELLELLTALQQSKFKDTSKNIEEEIADVLICLEQMQLHYDKIKIVQWRSYKVCRLKNKVLNAIGAKPQNPNPNITSTTKKDWSIHAKSAEGLHNGKG